MSRASPVSWNHLPQLPGEGVIVVLHFPAVTQEPRDASLRFPIYREDAEGKNSPTSQERGADWNVEDLSNGNHSFWLMSPC